VDHGRGWKGDKAHNQVNEMGVLFGGRRQQRERPAIGCAQGNQNVAEERQILGVAQGFNQAVVAADDGQAVGFVVLFLNGLGDKELHRFQFVAGR